MLSLSMAAVLFSITASLIAALIVWLMLRRLAKARRKLAEAEQTVEDYENAAEVTRRATHAVDTARKLSVDELLRRSEGQRD